MMYFNFKTKKGFTLLEMLVAVSVLMVAVAAPITIAQKGLSSAIYSKDQMIASYLAQDVIEYIKNQRDFASINAYSSWDSMWAGPLVSCLNADCEIDTVHENSFGGSNVQSIVSPSSPTFLRKDNLNKFYSYSSDEGVVTKFKRAVHITRPYGDYGNDEALVTVTVSWDQGEVVVHTLIFNY